MPKMKTNRAAAKRFRYTAKGKIRRRKAYRSHILTKKSSKRKRQLRQPAILKPCDEKIVKPLLPYGG